MRHGHTAWNRSGRIQGRVDEPLDDEARDHLSRLQLPEEFAQATLLCSPLSRTIETARLVGGREPAIVPELVEMDWGDWQGKRGRDLLANAESGYCHVEDWTWDFCPPEGESLEMVWRRVAPWIERVCGSVVAVTHIGIMRVILARATAAGSPDLVVPSVKRNRLYIVDVEQSGSLSSNIAPVRLIEQDHK